MRRRCLVNLFCLLALCIPYTAQADVLDAEPLNVGFDGMRFSASSTHNVVMHVTITADTDGGTLTAMFLHNEFPSPAEEGPDIVSGSATLWYAYPDTGSLNTTTAQNLGSFAYYSPPSQMWEIFPDAFIQAGGGLYITVDITSAPRENATCAFYTMANEIEFGYQSAPNTFPSSDMPSSPPIIYLTSYSAPTNLRVGYDNIGPSSLSTGQLFSSLEFDLDNVNSGQTGPVYLRGISITVRDQTNAVIAPDRALESIGIRDGVNDTLMAFVTSMPSTAVPLFLPLTISPYSNSVLATADRTLRLFATVTSNTATVASQFRLGWEGAYDLNAVYLYTMNAVTTTAAPGYTFPMRSNLYTVGYTATDVQVYHTTKMDDNTVVLKGRTGVNPMDFTFQNPGTSLTSRVDITHLTLAVLDSVGNTLSPASVFSRVAITGGVVYGENTSLPSSGNLVPIPLSNNYISVPAYLPVTVSVEVDILPNASAVDFKLSLNTSIAVIAQDANRQTPVTASAAFVSDPFPMQSHVVRIANSFSASGQSLAPVTLYPGQRINLLEFTFTHPGPSDMSDLQIRGVTLTANTSLASVCSRVVLWSESGAKVAEALPSPSASRLYLALSNFLVSPLTSVRLRVEVEVQHSPSAQTTLSLGLADNTDVDVYQPSDPSRPVYVAGSWPIMSRAAAVGGGEGRLRLSNYPNPFAAGRTGTRIAYYLDQSCNVTAALYTLAGDEVLTLCQREFQAAGEHILTWSGRTASAAVVVNGVYLLRIEAVPVVSGSTIVQQRKIAVVK